MSELWDVYDLSGRLLERKIGRGENLRSGEYHLVVHIWIIDSHKRLLIQRRIKPSGQHESHWFCTAGSAVSGETSVQAAVRETYEEIGICLQSRDFRLLKRLVSSDCFYDIWFAYWDGDIRTLKLDSAEVLSVKWTSIPDLKKMFSNGSFFEIEPQYLAQLTEEVLQNSRNNTESIVLRKAAAEDLKLIHEMQVESFLDLFNRYQDPETNPAAEPIEAIQRRFKQENSDYYLICTREKEVGAIRVVTNQEKSEARISPMFIVPQYQNRGIGLAAINEIESVYPSIKKWELDTVKEEELLCHFYRSAGYIEVGKPEEITAGQTLQYFEKTIS